MLRFRHVLPLARPTVLASSATLVALLAVVATGAGAQESGGGTPLHLAASRFDFVVSTDTQPGAKPLRVHNGGTAAFTDVRLTRVTYADSARGSGWLFAAPRQSSVAPDELAIVQTLCVDATGLPAGTYRATAGVAAREVPAPVPFTVTLVVKEGAAGAHASHAARGAGCGTAVTKDAKGS